MESNDPKKGRKRLAITMGDPAGIGAEISVKALNKKDVYDAAIPIIIGDKAALEDAVRFCYLDLKLHEIQDPSEATGEYGTIDYINMNLLQPGGWEYKKVSALCGDVCFQYIEKGIALALARKVDAVVTAPINKESLHMAGHHYSGHTEIFAEYTHTPQYAMLLASGIRTDRKLCVIHVSTHVSLREACDRVKKARVEEVIRLADHAMKLLGYEHPRIAVAGLNPHCSEDGLFGHEEADEIIPAIEAMKNKGYAVEGPIPPDAHKKVMDDLEWAITTSTSGISYGENMINAGKAGSTYRLTVEEDDVVAMAVTTIPQQAPQVAFKVEQRSPSDSLYQITACLTDPADSRMTKEH